MFGFKDSKDASIQVNFLFNYLSSLDCTTIIKEGLYHDYCYMDDYLNFYGSCTRDYPRKCVRLHFFKKITEPPNRSIKNQIEACYQSQDEEEYNRVKLQLQKSYLGFLVIKPLLDTKIGRTLLTTPNETNKRCTYGFQTKKRQIITLIDYSAHLFGISLKVKSLPFQQQDTVIAACATIALWPILHKVGDLFGFYSPTPFEITRQANENFACNRMTPSDGLSTQQVISTMKSFGYEVEFFSFNDQDLLPTETHFLALCYAYLRGGIPIFVGATVETFGFHALAMLGYHLQEEFPQDLSKNGLPMRGNRIQSFYVHDDNVGPFAEFQVKIKNPGDPQKVSYHLIWDEYKNKKTGNFAEIQPDLIAIPLFPKIRISYLTILNLLKLITNGILLMVTLGDLLFEWDCFLSTSNVFKEDLLSNAIQLPVHVRERMVKIFLPRFIWRSTIFLSGVPFLEILGDATEARNALPFFTMFLYNLEKSSELLEIASQLRQIPDDDAIKNFFREAVGNKTLSEFFFANIKNA